MINQKVYLRMFRLLALLMLAMVVSGISGCYTADGFMNSKTGDIYTQEEAASLPDDIQANLVPVTYRGIKPEVETQVNSFLQATTATTELVKPFIPLPYGDLAAVVLTGLTSLWLAIKKRQVVGTLAKVTQGATITAQTVNEVVKPSIEVWTKFKAAQKDASKGTAAIMPDKLLE